MTVLNADVDFTIIPALKDNEGLIIHVDVGNMPTSMALKHVDQVRTAMLSVVAEEYHNRYFFAPARDGLKSISITKTETVEEQQ